MLLSLFDGDWMAFLKDFVYCDQSFERLDFIGHYRLPKAEMIESARPPRRGEDVA